MVKSQKGEEMTEMIQGGTVTAPALTAEKRGEIQMLLAELLLLSAAAAAVRRGPLPSEERERRLRPIVARREALEERLFG